MNISYSKLKQKNDDTLLLKCNWGINSINILIVKGINTWKSYVDETAIRHLLNHHNFTFDEYFNNLKKYITDESLNDIRCEIENDSFSIYKTYNITIKYFYCNIEKVEPETCITHIIADLISNKNLLENRVDKLEKENLQLSDESTKYADKLKEINRIQEQEEKKLYASFILLLNEKKKRIQFLTETLESFKANKLEELQIISIQSDVENASKRRQQLEVISDTEYETDDDDVDGENEENSISKNTTSYIDDLAQPSTSYEERTIPRREKRKLQTDVVENKKKQAIEESMQIVINEDVEEQHSPVIEINTQDFL